MNVLSELKSAIADMLPEKHRPLVVHSAVWPILREIGRADDYGVAAVLDTLLQVADGRTILMPAFTSGYVEGECDLDKAPASTGKLCEAFRLMEETRRSKSAFFSFSVAGEAHAAICDLMPEDAWGDHSLYEWMERENVRFLTLGAHPTHVSYLHRMEWLVRDRISYRYMKRFSGVLIHEGQRIPCTERLYVRSLVPEAVNDFTVLVEHLRTAGMLTASVRGISVASYDARNARDVILPAMEADPMLVLANRSEFVM